MSASTTTQATRYHPRGTLLNLRTIDGANGTFHGFDIGERGLDAKGVQKKTLRATIDGAFYAKYQASVAAGTIPADGRLEFFGFFAPNRSFKVLSINAIKSADQIKALTEAKALRNGTPVEAPVADVAESDDMPF